METEHGEEDTMRSTRRWVWAVIIGIVVSVGGCAAQRERARVASQEQYNGRVSLESETANGPPAFRAAFAPARRANAGGGDRAAAAQDDATLATLAESRPDRYLIKNATLSLEVQDARQASTALVAAVQTAGGYVADTHEAVDALGQRSVTVQARVPFGRFDRSMQQIEALGKVLERQVSAEDVTEEFVDSQAKLRNLKRTESRLLEHLGRTGKLADTLLVEKELNRVRGEIEQLEGRLRFLQHRVTFSTLTVAFSESPSARAVVPPHGYSSAETASGAIRALVTFARVFWSGAIWAVIWAIVWIPMVLGGWMAYRRR
jgi:Domain of unknown function (DUF4349)